MGSSVFLRRLSLGRQRLLALMVTPVSISATSPLARPNNVISVHVLLLIAVFVAALQIVDLAEVCTDERELKVC